MDWDGGGGGFVNDSISEEPQQGTGAVSIGGEDRNKALTAVSVGQVAKLTRPSGEGLIIHGRKINQITIVAFVYEVLDINSQKVHVLLDDFTGSGPLEASHIIGDTGAPDDDPTFSMFNDPMQTGGQENGDSQSRQLNTLKPGDYVRCVGVVKFHQDKSNLVIYNMRIVDDPNEVTMHTLEVIRDSMYYERAQATGGGAFPLSTSAAPFKTKQENNAYNGRYQEQAGSKNEFGKLSTRDKHLLKFLQDEAIDSGVTFAHIKNNFKAFRENEIRESLETLTSEGMCWQGDDEDSWCVAAQDS